MTKTSQSREYNAVEFLDKCSGIAAIAGSQRFYFQISKAIEQLTMRNWSVFTPNSWDQSFSLQGLNADISKNIKLLPFRRIYDSHVLVVVTAAAFYTDTPAVNQILFARQLKLPVFYFDGFSFG